MALAASTASAFVVSPPLHHHNIMRRTTSSLPMSGAADEVAALRAAAAKAREEANRLSKELGKEIVDTSPNSSSTSVVAPAPILSYDDVLSATSALDFTSGDATSQSAALDQLVTDNKLSYWKSAAKLESTALRVFPVSLDFMTSRSAGTLTAESLGVENSERDVSLDDFKDATIVVAGGSMVAAVASLALLPENIGAGLCYFFALVPVLYLGVGSSAPGLIASVIASTRSTKDDDTTRNDRICRHEAAHFLCGYLCGLPVKNYEITADTGVPCVEFHPSTEMDAINQRRELTMQEITALSVVAMSGSVAEAIAFEKARGGENDLLELNNLFRRSKEFLGASKQQDLTRWGALAAYNMIKTNADQYDRLVEAFKEKKTVAECIAAIESS